MRKPNNNLQMIADQLGKQYSLINVDMEWSIYRDLHNGYDIEITNHSRKGLPINATVHVWQVRDQLKVIQRTESINDIATLRRVLRCVVNQTNHLSAKKNKVYRPILVAAV